MKWKIKTIGTLCAMFFALLFVMPVSAAPTWYTVEGIEGGRVQFDPETGTITDCSLAVTVANIPEKIAGVPVTAIGDKAFASDASNSIYKELISVTIPEGVTSIGEGAFQYQEYLKNVSIPESVTSIGSFAFYLCFSLENVTIPEGVTRIEKYTFDCCRKLKLEKLPENLTYIGDRAFWNCNGLKSITIPKNVEIIGDEAFHACYYLTSVSFPDSVEISTGAFSECTRLTSVSIPVGTSLEKQVFADCTGLSKVTISGGATSFGTSVFKDCTKLTSAGPTGSGCNIEYGWRTEIPANVFSDCSSLEKVILSDKIKTIGDSAFSNCTKLISAGPSGSGSNFEYGWTSKIPTGVFKNILTLQTVNIAEGITTIEDSAFSGCTALATVEFPESLKNIGNSAFSNCKVLTNPELPDGLTAIGEAAFSNCKVIDGVTIPATVETIEASTFSGCSVLKNLTIPVGTTSIGSKAFANCTSLPEVLIPEGMLTIGVDAFSNCTSLASVKLPASLTSIGEDAFGYCAKLIDAGPIGSGCDVEYAWEKEIPTGFSRNFEELILGPEIVKVASDMSSGYCLTVYNPTFSDFEFVNSALLETIRGYEGSTAEAYALSNDIDFETLDDVEYFEKEPETCELPGRINVWYCNDCEKYYSELYHVNELTEKEIIIPAFGHSYETVVTDPTCTEVGYSTHTCVTCGDTYTDSEVEALGHELSEWQTTKEPDCTELGSKEKNCSRCDYYETEEIPALGHDDEMIITATCENSGYEVYICKVCGRRSTGNAVEAFGHDLGDWETTKESDCTEIGEKVKNCSRCDYYETEEIPATGHLYEKEVTAPTCEEDGYTTHTCRLCGDIYTDSETEKLGHDLSDWEVLKQATCAQMGIAFRACSRCEYSESKRIPELEHSYRMQVVPPTCENVGYDAYTCKDCAANYTDNEVAALGHDLGDWETVKEPDCTEKGKKEKNCSRCSYKEEEEIPANGHGYETVVTGPSCEEEGYSTHTCSVCGDSYVDSEVAALGHDLGDWETVKDPDCIKKGKKEKNCSRCIYKEEEEIPANGHSYETVVTDPTCGEEGYSTHTCSICGDNYVDSEIEALGHDLSKWITTKEPDCTNLGEKERNCSRCSYKEEEEIPANGHKYNTVVTDPTCEKAGYSTHTCRTCGDSYVNGEEKKLGHNLSNWKTVKEPDCINLGEKERSCSRCSYKEEGEIPANGHSYETVVTAPTCTEDGYSTHTCSVCGDSYMDSEVEALGHSFTNYISDNNAAPGSMGTKTAKCDRCDETDTIDDPDSYIPPTLEAEGVTRIAGSGRVETGLLVADIFKATIGVEKFDTVIIATSKTFADALPGSYLAYVKQAPILLVSDARMDEIVTYVKENLADGGTIYILGGTTVVSDKLEGKFEGYDVKRLQVDGKGRYFTNLEILKEAGVQGGEMIVATGDDFADSLSASASKLPILMVRGKTLSDAQKEFLAAAGIEKFYIVGGEKAVDPAMEAELEAYASAAEDKVVRVAGGNRRETSIEVAKAFAPDATVAVTATAANFPDGLCGGALAAAMDAPLILTVDKKMTEAVEYFNEKEIVDGYVLGGASALSDETISAVFDLLDSDEIKVVE